MVKDEANWKDKIDFLLSRATHRKISREMTGIVSMWPLCRHRCKDAISQMLRQLPVFVISSPFADDYMCLEKGYRILKPLII